MIYNATITGVSINLSSSKPYLHTVLSRHFLPRSKRGEIFYRTFRGQRVGSEEWDLINNESLFVLIIFQIMQVRWIHYLDCVFAERLFYPCVLSSAFHYLDVCLLSACVIFRNVRNYYMSTHRRWDGSYYWRWKQTYGMMAHSWLCISPGCTFVMFRWGIKLFRELTYPSLCN